MSPTAMITGISGQDGSLLAEFLLGKDYEVIGLVRSDEAASRLLRYPVLRHAHAMGRLTISVVPIDGLGALVDVIRQVHPDEIYHLAGQSHVHRSFEDPLGTVQANAIGSLNVMMAVLEAEVDCRMVQAGSADMFGNARDTPQTEMTSLAPTSPYASSKALAHQLGQQLRKSRGLRVWNAILYPHESTRRDGSFVFRKITKGVASIVSGEADSLALGNLDARRDWGAANDTVRALWMMMNSGEPDDYIVATGIAHSVKDVVEAAFTVVGLSWSDYVRIDERFLRPADPHVLVGDASKLRRETCWIPNVSFDRLIAGILDYDLALAGVDGRNYPHLQALLPVDADSVDGEQESSR